ncbi:MAG: acyl-ACP--UDP-N-acetylglucosamine O-acyltransferase [Planctomycetes bacterium]|nr:acyl-ACP--UDP-N-acetylglucosamine O-acyltransferase [Planctomycetota bacterium]
MSIHATAVVDRCAELGREVTVGPYSVIGPEVRLGDRVRIGSHVVIEGRTSVGEGTEIFPFAMVGSMPGHLADRGDGTALMIGARVSIREHVSLHRGTKVGTGRTIIGDECTFFSHAHVGHDCVLGKGVLLINGARLGGHVEADDFAIFGGNVGVHQSCRVGAMTMIGGGSIVAQDVPPYCLASGERARLIGLNEVGLERRGIPAETVKALRGVYRIIFRSGLRREDALARVGREFAAVPEAIRFVEFIKGSKRGVARHGRSSGA